MIQWKMYYKLRSTKRAIKSNYHKNSHQTWNYYLTTNCIWNQSTLLKLSKNLTAMIDQVKVQLQINDYSFFGLPLFWWVSILIFAGVILAAAHLYRKKK